MPERPPIPAELRREILVEAGHRCAIHTCRYQEVDVHHIVPWARCQEHRAENLIALCPNCHRRAEKGEIDRKSLRMYKARLIAPLATQGFVQYPHESAVPGPSFAWIDPTGAWVAKRVERDQSGADVGVEYPFLDARALGNWVEPINEFIERWAKEQVRQSASQFEGGTPASYFVEASFSVLLLSSSLISVRFAFASFTGGAHGAHWTESLNLLTRSVTNVGIEDLFSEPARGVKALSDYAISHLLSADEGRQRDERSVREGAAADSKNFRSFNFTRSSLLLTFDEYQVGSYAEGASEVDVPFGVIRPMFTPTIEHAVSEFG